MLSFCLLIVLLTPVAAFWRRVASNDDIANVVKDFDRAPGAHLVPTIETSSTCFGEYTSQLPNGCDSLLTDTDLRIVYAINMAWCELKLSGQQVPRSCEKEALQRTGHQKCLKQMLDTTQWTSYSNFFQWTTLMCHATQAQRMPRSIGKLLRDVVQTQTTNKQLQDEQSVLLAAQLSSLKTLIDLVTELVHSIENARENSRDLGNDIHDLHQTVQDTNKAAKVALTDLQELRARSQDSLQTLKEMQTTVTGTSETAEEALQRALHVNEVMLASTDSAKDAAAHMRHAKDTAEATSETLGYVADQVRSTASDAENAAVAAGELADLLSSLVSSVDLALDRFGNRKWDVITGAVLVLVVLTGHYGLWVPMAGMFIFLRRSE